MDLPVHGRRDRSSSSNSYGVCPKSSTIRIKPAPRASSSSSTKQIQPPSASDEQSLTSFPSLSPSLAASPDSTFRYGPSTGSPIAVRNRSFPKPDRPASSTALDDLFSPASTTDERSALFQDTPKQVRDVPGTLHHQSDSHVEHMIARVGTVTLVKQMALDLAERDAHITLLQRRAKERERLLRKMLRDCEVSNLDIETQLKELERSRLHNGAGKIASGKSRTSSGGVPSTASIDDQMEEAFEDVIGEEEATNGAAETVRQPSVFTKGSRPVSGRTSLERHTLGSERGSTIRKASTTKGWADVFGLQGATAKRIGSKRAPMQRSESAQQRLSAIHTASQNNLRRKGLSTDTFQPPPLDDEDEPASHVNGILGSRLEKIASNDASSTKSSTSVASWAMKLVGGKQADPDDQKGQINRERATTLDQPTSNEAETSAPLGRVKSGSAVADGKGRKGPSRALPARTAPNGNKKRAPPGPSITATITGTSPDDSRATNGDGPGPMEMDTILPDNIRPPTQLPHENVEDSTGYLTDRFGFIYDNRRKLRQAQPTPSRNRSNRNSRVETLENHRKSVNSLGFGDEDTISVNSRFSAENRPVSPASFGPVGDVQPSRRWQDYLKLSSVTTELLSHTPSAAPITDIVTGPTKGKLTRPPPPQITISKRGSVIAQSSNPLPSPSRIVSENAELATPSKSGSATPTSPVEVGPDPVKSLLDQLTEVHDSLQREKTAKWNEFLRKVRAERKRNGETSSGSDRRHKAVEVPEASLMDGEMIGISGLGNEGKVGRAKWNEFKNLVLGGIPVAYRAKIWAECSGASGMRVPGYYDELVATETDDQIIVQQIQMDIPRTLTDNIFFRKGQGMQKLSEILLAYATRNPDIGYCQGMNLIAANLLLIMPAAEDAFWVLASMIENILPEKYYDHSLLTSRADQAVLRQYVTTLFPQLSTHLEDLSIELEALTFQWFLSVFTDCLSAEALFRLWDVVLCTQDGATFLFQVALALLKLNEKSLLACDSPAEVYAYINQRMTDHAISIDGLIKASEALKKVVKREDVVKRRAAVVEQELQTARERDAIRKGKAKARDAEPPASTPSPAPTTNTENEDTPKRASNGIRQKSFVSAGEDEAPYHEELEYRQPMPIDEEVQWRA